MYIGLNMKLRIQTLTGQIGEVEADPENTILDLKVRINSLSGSREEWPKQTLIQISFLFSLKLT